MHLVKKEERRKGDLKIGRPPQPVREVGSTLPETLPDFPVTRLAVTFLYMPHRDDAHPVIHCLERHTAPSTLREYTSGPSMPPTGAPRSPAGDQSKLYSICSSGTDRRHCACRWSGEIWRARANQNRGRSASSLVY